MPVPACHASAVSTLLLVLLLGACSALPPPAPTEWRDYRTRAERLNHWQLDAKVALRWPGGAESANLSWSQRDQRTELDLYGPLGAGAVRVTHAKGVLDIEQNGERHHYDTDTPEALAAATGWPIPIAALPYWLRGIPDPRQPVDRLELRDGRAALIEQDGWTARYPDYMAVADGSLPSELRLTHPGRDVTLRLIRARWTLESTP